MLETEPNRPSVKSPSVVASLRFAFQGLVLAIHTERNLRIHFTACMLGCLVCILIHPPLHVTVIGLVAGFLVIASELFNTAIENVTDMTTNHLRHPLAKVAKDTAAGAVLCVSIGAALVGVYLASLTYPWTLRPLSTEHVASAVLSAAIFLLLSAIWAYSMIKHRKKG